MKSVSEKGRGEGGREGEEGGREGGRLSVNNFLYRATRFRFGVTVRSQHLPLFSFPLAEF